MKRALITGITGQDGAYLSKFLLSKGYEVFGLFRRTSNPNFWRLQELNVLDKVTLIPGDMTDESSLMRAVKISNPDEIYNLAAQSFVGSSFDQPITTQEIDGMGCLRFMEIIRNYNKKIKFYQASTSELYGDKSSPPQSETTKFLPSSPYAVAKLYAFHSVRVYRESYGLFACNGILFNHESPIRGLEFVTRKITNAVARIKLGLQKELRLGNLEARRDWGYAEEYVEGMWQILQRDKPDDYVISTGENHSVREFAEAAFEAVGLNWKDYVISDSALQRPNDVNFLLGDNSKLQRDLGWKPKTTFKELVKKMVDADLSRWQRYLRGEVFAWDAPNFSEANVISNEPDVITKKIQSPIKSLTIQVEKPSEPFREITACRICGNKDLIPILNLGNQPLSGRFPSKDSPDPPIVPLELIKCNDSNNSEACGLLQLKHTANLEDMYGATYGYRSGLNKSMVNHLTSLAKVAEQLVDLNKGDAILDIGSSDGTMLKTYSTQGVSKIGIDPAAEKYKEFYTGDVKLIPDFFSAEKYNEVSKAKAKIITSVAMFYDLEQPQKFVNQIKEILHPEGIWILEQSYMPSMLEVNSFDTICQEHLEYYSFKQIEWLLSRAGLKVFDVDFNDVNGGSFRIYACHKENPRPINLIKINDVRNKEMFLELNTLRPYNKFKNRVEKIKTDIQDFLRQEKAKGKKIHIYGASTKGNVLLHYFNIGKEIVDLAADVNKDKFGCVTPGTRIPIISEEESIAMNPDYYLVLPWHFKNGFIEKMEVYLKKGGKLLFPLPYPEVIRVDPKLPNIVQNDTVGKTDILGQ